MIDDPFAPLANLIAIRNYIQNTISGLSNDSLDKKSINNLHKILEGIDCKLVEEIASESFAKELHLEYYMELVKDNKEAVKKPKKK